MILTCRHGVKLFDVMASKGYILFGAINIIKRVQVHIYNNVDSDL